MTTVISSSGISYSLESGNVIGFLKFSADTDFIWITTEGSSAGSRSKELSNEEFGRSYIVLSILEYYQIKEYKNIETTNREDVKFTIRLSDGMKKHELLIVEKGVIIADWFGEDGVIFTKLYIVEKDLKNLLKELNITNPL